MKDEEWGTDSPAVVRVDRPLNDEEKGPFGWLYAHREKIIVNGMKYLFLLGLSLIYLSGVITLYDALFDWLMASTVGIQFAWKALAFGAGLGVLVFATTLLLYFVMVAYYMRFWGWFEDRLEFIDPVRRLD